MSTVCFTAPLQMWAGDSHARVGFVVIGGLEAEAISAHELTRRLELGQRRGFGSVKVTAQIGGSRWPSSVFPHVTNGWFLPIKKAVRLAEGLQEGEPVEAELQLT